MASIKRTKKITSRACVCDLCGFKAHSIPGTRHRRCGGAQGKEPRPKHAAVKNAGQWS